MRSGIFELFLQTSSPPRASTNKAVSHFLFFFGLLDSCFSCRVDRGSRASKDQGKKWSGQVRVPVFSESDTFLYLPHSPCSPLRNTAVPQTARPRETGEGRGHWRGRHDITTSAKTVPPKNPARFRKQRRARRRGERGANGARRRGTKAKLTRDQY